MSPICVSFATRLASRIRENERPRLPRSIYQDVPLYTIDDFKRLAPQEARTEDVLSDEHQLMLNRLSFELAERQRFANPLSHDVNALDPTPDLT